MTYQPKVGDRVRVTRTLEGKVTDTERGHWMSPHFMLEVDGAGYHEIHDEDQWSFEKLQDPEPQWVNGDVILVIGEGGKRTPMIYTRTRDEVFWACAECPTGWHLLAQVSADWSNGDVETLWKQDS